MDHPSFHIMDLVEDISRQLDATRRRTEGQVYFFKVYVGAHEVLPGCHIDPTSAAMMSTWMHDTDTFSKKHYLQSLVSDHSTKGVALKGYTAEQACIAWSDEENRLYIMLQAKDASSVDYKNLSTAGKKTFKN